MHHNGHAETEMSASARAAKKHPEGHEEHPPGMEDEFRRHFYVSAILTIPILILSSIVQYFFGY